jgi:hypothetical protein
MMADVRAAVAPGAAVRWLHVNVHPLIRRHSMSDAEILRSLRDALLRGESAGMPSPIVRLSDDELKVVVGGFGSLDISPSKTTTPGTTTCDGTCVCCSFNCDLTVTAAT